MPRYKSFTTNRTVQHHPGTGHVTDRHDRPRDNARPTKPLHGPKGETTYRLGLLTLVALLAPSITTQAGDSSACEKVRQRAKSKAALWFYPRLNATGLRIPNGTSTNETGAPIGKGQAEWQGRAYLSLSPMDIYKGAVVLELAEAKCEQMLAQNLLEDALDKGLNYGHKSALHRQVEYLTAQRKAADKLVAQQRRRYKQRLITLHEMRAMSMRRARFERHVLGLKEQLVYLRKDDAKWPKASIGAILKKYESATRRLERVESHFRKTAPWRIDLAGGTSWVGRPDWFATVSLSYGLGSIAQSLAEHRYLKAVDRELAHSPRSRSARTRALMQYLDESLVRHRKHLSLVRSQLRTIEALRAKLVRFESARKQQPLAVLEFDAYELRGEKIYLEEMISIRERSE